MTRIWKSAKRSFPWQDVRRVDRTNWISPLVVKLALYDDDTVVLVYPGEVDCCKHLLRTLRQMSTNALIDGTPYRQYWGELLGTNEARQLNAPRYRVLRPEDEEEVERLYFLLKTVGHIDPRNSGGQRAVGFSLFRETRRRLVFVRRHRYLRRRGSAYFLQPDPLVPRGGSR